MSKIMISRVKNYFNIFTPNEKIFVISISPLLIIFSLYSVSHGTWIWEEGRDFQRILGTLSGLASFTGIIASLLFFKLERSAYVWAILNALIFGVFTLSINLTGDFFVQLMWLIPIYIFMMSRIIQGKPITQYRFSLDISLMLIAIFIISFLLFFYITPILNDGWSRILNNASAQYGENFNNYWTGRILDVLSNTLTVTIIVMMLLGVKWTWYAWISKNFVAILFFSHFGVLNISIILMNVFYIFMDIFIIITSKNMKTTRVAIIGPGAVGKTTVLDNLMPFLKSNKFEIFDERDGVISDDFVEYMNDMPSHAFRMQKEFFKDRITKAHKLNKHNIGIMDRHSTDDFIFSRVHIDHNNFTPEQAVMWNKLEKKYFRILNRLEKLDHIFILMQTDEVIEKRRTSRSSTDALRETEIKNTQYFRDVNAQYHDKNSIMYKAFKFSKEQTFIVNDDSKQTALKIQDILEKKMKT